MLREALTSLEIERLCLAEFSRLCLRNRRYIALVAAMYGRAPRAPGRAQLMRATYCLARLLDDVLDGDRQVDGAPEAYVLRLMHDLENAASARRDGAIRLSRFVFTNLKSLAEGEEDPAADLRALIDLMLFDRTRARDRILLREEELLQHHHLTFASILNIALCIVDARIRARELTSLTRAQSILYTIRDLEEDLSRGLVNIPFEVLCESGHAEGMDLSYSALQKHPAVWRWIRQELAVGVQCAARADRFLVECSDRRAKVILGPLCRGLRGLARRLPKEFQGRLVAMP